jgi:UV DNA damage repair endonuclease
MHQRRATALGGLSQILVTSRMAMHRIRYVKLTSVKPSIVEQHIKQHPRLADKWLTPLGLVIPWSFAYDDA